MSNISFIKSSFWSLLSSEEIETITIPIIQRAYTQGGRKGNNKIEKKGQKFLDRLIQALKGSPITLDFVYGSKSKNNKLYPLDGQQRLTTLFLLHWYIVQKENKLSEEVKGVLKKFSYETRQSSRYFCAHLVEYKIETRKELLSDTIKNQKWFMLSWENDPSISSMLNMLDKIDLALQREKTDFWDDLTLNIQKSPITFFYTSLEELNLTDDLYIKMNARGLELTDFEKIKASFDQKIDEEEWEKDIKIEETFAHRIDTHWTNLFWKYKEKIEKKDTNGNIDIDYQIDNKLINFIAGTAINLYAQNLDILNDEKEEDKIRLTLIEKKENNITDDLIKRIRIEKRIAHLANNPEDVNPNDFPTKNAYSFLVNCLNKYTESQNDKIKTKVNLWNYCNSTLFEDFINKDEYSFSRQILFYAQTNYLLTNSYSETFFNDWMRVVRNIIHNNDFNHADNRFIGAINLINELTAGAGNIYEYLDTAKIESKIALEQIKEEIRKARIIIKYPDYKNIICDLEDTDFCKGSINWCLDCITTTFGNTYELHKLEKIHEIINLHFNKKDISNNIRRALLTIGNNDFYNYWGTWSWKTETNKMCLIEDRNDLKWNFTKGWYFDNYFKPLIIQLIDTNIQNLIESYLCPDSMPNWKKRLIKEPALLDKYCQRHYFGITKDKSKCYLYGGKKRPASRSECKLVK